MAHVLLGLGSHSDTTDSGEFSGPNTEQLFWSDAGFSGPKLFLVRLTARQNRQTRAETKQFQVQFPGLDLLGGGRRVINPRLG